MAVTARSSGLFLFACALAAAHAKGADDSAEIHQIVSAAAEALSSGNAAQAMSSFSKSYTDFDKLSRYFDALTGAYFVESQVDFINEDTAPAKATVTLHWALTLTTRQSGFTSNRNAELALKLVREGKRWRICELDPIEFFDPQGK